MGYKSLAQMPTRRNGLVSLDVRRRLLQGFARFKYTVLASDICSPPPLFLALKQLSARSYFPLCPTVFRGKVCTSSRLNVRVPISRRLLCSHAGSCSTMLAVLQFPAFARATPNWAFNRTCNGWALQAHINCAPSTPSHCRPVNSDVRRHQFRSWHFPSNNLNSVCRFIEPVRWSESRSYNDIACVLVVRPDIRQKK